MNRDYYITTKIVKFVFLGKVAIKAYDMQKAYLGIPNNKASLC